MPTSGYGKHKEYTGVSHTSFPNNQTVEGRTEESIILFNVVQRTVPHRRLCTTQPEAPQHRTELKSGKPSMCPRRCKIVTFYENSPLLLRHPAMNADSWEILLNQELCQCYASLDTFHKYNHLYSKKTSFGI